MGAPNKIWVDGDYVYETEAEARAETDDARLYIRADLVRKLIDYTKELHGDDWNECSCVLKEILAEIDL